MKPLKVKILGSGGAARKHAAAYADLPDLFEVTVNGDHDIVDVCTVNSHHFAQALDGISGSRHVIVEKPLCGAISECNWLIDHAKDFDRRIFPIFQYRFSGHEPVEYGIINRWHREASYWDGWRGDWRLALGGCLTTHGIHAIDLAIQKFGMPTSVSAKMGTKDGPETNANLLMRFAEKTFRILTIVSPGVKTGGFDWGDQHLGFVEQFRLVHQAITEKREIDGLPTVADAGNAIEVLTAAYYSAYTNDVVTLPIAPEHPFYRGWTQYFAQPSPHSPACPKTPG